jgi:hypothetical protein
MQNGKHKVIAGIAGPGLVLAALLAIALSNPGIGHAQSSPVQAGPGAEPGKSVPLAHPAVQTRPSSATAEPTSRGKHEGIKVHGHWTIEVRNPDSKLVSHTEFENSLVTAGALTGSALLTDLLGGSRTGGGWEIILATSSNAGLHIFQPNSPSAEICNAAVCSPNLSVVAGTTQSPRTLTLSGSAVVPAGQSSIIQVETDTWACIPTVLPAACATLSLADVNSGNASEFVFTSANLSPAITITPGQVVQAAVTISFQ